MSPVTRVSRRSSGNGKAEGALSNNTSCSIGPRLLPRSNSSIASRRPRKPQPPVMTMRIEYSYCGTREPDLTPTLPSPARGGGLGGGSPYPLAGSAVDAVARGPAEPGAGLALGAVFAADPAGIADLVQ